MKARLTILLALVLLGSVPALAQRARRAAKAEDTGPVSVTRSATLRVTIASDTIGIFDYLSDARKLAMWFPDQAVIEPQLGGRYHFRWSGKEGVWSGVVTEFIRGNTLGLTWKPPNEPYETNLRFKLSPQAGETIVELTHSGFTSSESMEMAVKAWRLYLENLKSVIEDDTDLREEMRRPAPRATRTRPRKTE